MKISYTEDSTLAAQDRYHEIYEFLKKHQIAVIEFKKKDGTIRIIEGTFDTTLMPPRDAETFHQTRVIDYETFPIWSVKDVGWKCFKTLNVISIKEKND